MTASWIVLLAIAVIALAGLMLALWVSWRRGLEYRARHQAGRR